MEGFIGDTRVNIELIILNSPSRLQGLSHVQNVCCVSSLHHSPLYHGSLEEWEEGMLLKVLGCYIAY